jgi:hypothetical protein
MLAHMLVLEQDVKLQCTCEVTEDSYRLNLYCTLYKSYCHATDFTLQELDTTVIRAMSQ